MYIIKKLFSGRIFITIVLLLVQIVWTTLFFLRLTKYSVALSILFGILSVLIVLHLVGSDMNPAYRTVWIIFIMALPILGGLLYLFIGTNWTPKQLRSRIARGHDAIVSDLRGAGVPDGATGCPRASARSRYIRTVTDYPLYDGSRVKYYPVGEAMFADMMEAVESAEHFIFLEYFIISPGKMWDELYAALRRKAAAGVEVRLMVDDMGSLFLIPDDFARTLEADGIRCLRFNPFVPLLSVVMNNRDHRKILVVDGHTAFNGGINLADEYINHTHPFGHWKDTGVRVEGEAVRTFTAMFLELWQAGKNEAVSLEPYLPHRYHPQEFASEGFVQPFGDSPLDGEPVSANVYADILAAATDYVYIMTPYLIIDDVMRASLVAAAKRGVDVRIVTPGIPDKKMVFRLTRSHYRPLLEAGVRIYEYTPGFVHAKSFVSDDACAVVGTINLDYRSLYLHFECGTYFVNCGAVADVREDSLAAMRAGREVQLSDCRPGFFGGLLDAVLRIIEPLC